MEKKCVKIGEYEVDLKKNSQETKLNKKAFSSERLN